MELFALLLGVCTALLLAAAAAAWLCACGLTKRRPPGPIGLPILGHLHLLGNLPHHTLAHLSKSYGPLLSLRLGSVPLIVASSPDLAKLILHTHDKIFSGRPQNFIVPQIAFHSLDIGFCVPGPYWKLMRQLCVTEFVSRKRLEYHEPMRQDELQRLMLSILAAQGMPISIREKLHTTISNLISRMTLGTRLQKLPSASKCLPPLLELFRMLGMFNVSDYIPWLAWMDLQGLGRRSKKAACIASSMLQEEIDRRRVGWSANGSPHDFLDVLLLASDNSKHTHLNVGDEHIRAVLMDMFVGGTDTSSVMIEWAMVELLTNKEKLMVLEKEINLVVGNSRFVQESDLPHLPYLHAVINETFRLHPITPLLVPRISMEPCQISGYHIPQNTLVYVNAWAIHRDPNIWDKPLDFIPERFLDNNVDILSQQCKFLPFGGGRRICPAWKLGVLNVQYILGSLIHAFDWKTLSTPQIKEKFGLAVCLEDPLVIVPRPKVSVDLFDRALRNHE